jgi:lipoprotein-anchoring transpeptidase ErfK/SrfK
MTRLRVLFLACAVLAVGATVAATPATAADADMQAIQQRLKNLGYDPGPINGQSTYATAAAVVAFQKVQGQTPTGNVTPEVRAALANPAAPAKLAERLGPNRVEVDLGRQLMIIYRGGRPAIISHVSTGNGERYCNNGKCSYAITPRGTFKITRMARGWVSAPLGQLYNPAYFTSSGHALHGSKSVPLHPASHGCVRIPMHTAEWFQTLLSRGMAVYVGG